MEQKLSPLLEEELLRIAEKTCEVISAPAYQSQAVSIQGLQWFKKDGCWEKLKEVNGLSLSSAFKNELKTRNERDDEQREQVRNGKQEAEVDEIQEVMKIGHQGWIELRKWVDENEPRYGVESDLITRMSKPSFYPSPKQTSILYRILRECREQGLKL